MPPRRTACHHRAPPPMATVIRYPLLVIPTAFVYLVKGTAARADAGGAQHRQRRREPVAELRIACCAVLMARRDPIADFVAGHPARRRPGIAIAAMMR